MRAGAWTKEARRVNRPRHGRTLEGVSPSHHHPTHPPTYPPTHPPRWVPLQVPNTGGEWPEELGGKLYPDVRGPLSLEWQRQLREDCR